MSPLDHRHDDLERLLGDALGARAHLRTVDAAAVEHHRAQVHAAVDEGVVSLDVDDPDEHRAAWDGAGPRPRWRRPTKGLVLGLAAAATAAVVAVTGVGVFGWGRSASTPPAGSVQVAASQRWQDYELLDRPQDEEDRKGVPELGTSVVPGSVRLLVKLGEVSYFAGFDPDGRLAWSVVHPSGGEGGTHLQPSSPEPLEVSDGSTAPALWLVPRGVDTSDLAARGFVALLPSVWVDADALGTAEDLFARLRAPQTADDAVPAGGTFPFGESVTPASVRKLAQEGPKSLYLGTSASGEVCLAIVDGEVAGSSCRVPVVVASEGMWVGLGGPEGSTTAWLAPDDLDTSGWPALGRRQLTLNLWYAQPEDDGPDPAAHRLELADGTTAFTGTRGEGLRFDIRLTGRVVVLDGGCLGLGLDDGTRTGVLVLQSGTTVLDGGRGLITPAGVVLRVGDTVVGTDGGSGVAGTGLQEAWKASSPACFAGHEVTAVDVTEVIPS